MLNQTFRKGFGFIALVLLFALPFASSAQVPVPIKDTTRTLLLTGYIQTQYQHADSAGIPSYDGGDFTSNLDSRFAIRRARIQADYTRKFITGTIQFDLVPTSVRITDAYLQFSDPKFQTFNLGMGLTNVPFGYEVLASSYSLESIERSRLIQTLFPDEKDLGAHLIVQSPQAKWNTLKLSLALVNGSGRNFNDYDSRKNFVTSLQFDASKLLKKSSALNQLGVGVSYYNGGVRNNTNSMFYNGTDALGNKGFIEKPVTVGDYATRRYTGAHFLIGVKSVLGTTKFNTEYISGKQPGVAAGGAISGPLASRSFGVQPATPLYNREFEGYYFTLTQSLGKLPVFVVAKYDYYDPNTFVSGKTIGLAGNLTNAGDIAYNTWGLGSFVNIYKGAARLAIYYDFVTNESTSVTAYTHDIKDDVFTVRAQFKF
ncbi:porin [Solitalea koreensis]|uniref:Phosphate-selective porin n=1 Tax=Solitalea koreensis TaxID=543615 RepID=A0A521AHI7_9SPHI|nr:porin [Solitalea koreensis]SMO34272.1 Phosphate-selective porin [Solitalea koreensis]